jgi:hypothetical protein
VSNDALTESKIGQIRSNLNLDIEEDLKSLDQQVASSDVYQNSNTFNKTFEQNQSIILASNNLFGKSHEVRNCKI